LALAFAINDEVSTLHLRQVQYTITFCPSFAALSSSCFTRSQLHLALHFVPVNRVLAVDLRAEIP